MSRIPTEEILKARTQLMDLRLTLEQIKLRTPTRQIGDDPSAADVCGRIIEMLEYGLRQLEVFVG